MLSACYDKIELENRGFVVSIGIDKNTAAENKKFALSVTLPNVAAIAGGNSDGETKSVIKTESDSLSNAMLIADSLSPQKLYYGQAEICVFGREALSDRELMLEALDALERNRELPKRLIMLSADDEAAEILAAKPGGDGAPLVGMFVSSYYRNLRGGSGVPRRSLEEVIRDSLAFGCALIPSISTEDDGKIQIKGAAVLRDFALSGFVGQQEVQGLLLTTGKAAGSQVLCNYEGTSVPLSIHKNNAKTKFYEENGELCLGVSITVEGIVDEFKLNEGKSFDTDTIHALENIFAEEIERIAKDTLYEFQKVHFADCYLFISALQKYEPALYEKYGANWNGEGGVFGHANVNFSAGVTIRSTGATK